MINLYSLFKMISKFVQEQLSLTKWDPRPNSMVLMSNSFSAIICSEGSFRDDQSLAGIRWTISDKSSNLIACGAAAVRSFNVLQTEILVLLAGLLEAHRRGLSQVEFFTDSWLLNQLINDFKDQSTEAESTQGNSKDNQW